MWNFLGGGATVIPGATSIPESRVGADWFNSSSIFLDSISRQSQMHFRSEFFRQNSFLKNFDAVWRIPNGIIRWYIMKMPYCDL